MNTRVLIIDDEEFVRDNIEEVLAPRKQTDPRLAEALSLLLSEEETPRQRGNSPRVIDFLVDKARSGEEGLEKVRAALAQEEPYAVIFLDMRMPGWDGLETANKIREFDARAEIIFLTAFSDRSIEEIVDQVGQNVSYHCKPYANEEIIQMATKAVTDYHQLRELEKLLGVIATIITPQHNLNILLQNVLDQLVVYLNTDVALLGKVTGEGRYEKLFSVGPVGTDLNLHPVLDKLATAQPGRYEVVQEGETVFTWMDPYCVFAFLGEGQKLKTEKLYLLKLFVQNATIAIRNAELYERLLQKEKLSAIGQALGMILHDLRSPIGSLKMLTAWVRENGVTDEDLDMFDQIGDQSMAIVNDFLDFVRETSVVKKPIRLKALADSCMAQVAAQAPGVRLTARIDPELSVMGDESKLGRVLLNLFNNAVDALKNHPNPEIQVSAQAESSGIRLQVRDNGSGIPPEIAETLFEPFVTRHKAHGTGLGLAIVKQFVQAHGGSITTRNDEGAVFDLYLPAH